MDPIEPFPCTIERPAKTKLRGSRGLETLQNTAPTVFDTVPAVLQYLDPFRVRLHPDGAQCTQFAKLLARLAAALRPVGSGTRRCDDSTHSSAQQRTLTPSEEPLKTA